MRTFASHDADAQVFHADTALDAQGRVVSAGGRVLTVCAHGADIAAARAKAYATISGIHLDGAFWRRDIGHRALARG